VSRGIEVKTTSTKKEYKKQVSIVSKNGSL